MASGVRSAIGPMLIGIGVTVALTALPLLWTKAPMWLLGLLLAIGLLLLLVGLWSVHQSMRDKHTEQPESQRPVAVRIKGGRNIRIEDNLTVGMDLVDLQGTKDVKVRRNITVSTITDLPGDLIKQLRKRFRKALARPPR